MKTVGMWLSFVAAAFVPETMWALPAKLLAGRL